MTIKMDDSTESLTPCTDPYADCSVCKGSGIHEGNPCSSCVWRRWADKNLDLRPIDILNPDRKSAITEMRCTAAPFGCGEAIEDVSFKDDTSRREFAISGLCQSCQDVAFAPESSSASEGCPAGCDHKHDSRCVLSCYGEDE